MDLKKYGYTHAIKIEESDLLPGRVTEHQRGQYTVVTPHGETTATLKGAFLYEAETSGDYPCVGDFVLLNYNTSGHSQIRELIPRRSKFSRADFSGHAAGYVKTIKEQVIAANFDYVFIVISLGQLFKISRITRYLTPAWQSGAQPVVILTKSDLVPDTAVYLTEVESAAPGVPVHAVSSHTGYGLEVLSPYLQPGKTVVFLGMSGVGKSSLLNALMQQEVTAVSGIREEDSRGRHTTTHRQLFMLPGGAMVIDTPGMRELGLFDIEDGIKTGFSDVEALFAGCRFSDCRHESEPDCAVRAALAAGTLAITEWNRYLKHLRENKFVESKRRNAQRGKRQK